jgi:hypothetical protein
MMGVMNLSSALEEALQRRDKVLCVVCPSQILWCAYVSLVFNARLVTVPEVQQAA